MKDNTDYFKVDYTKAMNTIDFSVTIKSIPKEEIDDVWSNSIELMMQTFGEIVEPSYNIVIDFNNLADPESFYQILSRAMTEHAIANAMKIVKE